MSKRYFSLDKADQIAMPFNIFIGGRGTGKTYGVLKAVYERNGTESKFMYLRRTEVEVASIADDKYNPYKALNRMEGYNVKAKYIAKNGVGEFYTEGEEGTKFLGYASALTTFGKLRGADLCDVAYIAFDEFIKSKTGHPIKEEADLFFNAYETINRNREIEGRPPVIAYLLTNATTLASPILEELNLIEVIENMKKKGQLSYTDKQRGLHLELLDDMEISKEKKDTALYKLTTGTKYLDHALNNEFAYDSFENIIKVKLSEYTPWIELENNVFIYRHKNRLEYYVCESKGNCQHVFKGDKKPLFKRNFGGRFYQLMIGGYVFYENFGIKQRITSYFE